MSGGGDDGLPEEHEEHVNHEAWVIPYADLLTLLMAMFIALFAMSTVDMSKFKALAIGFNEALDGPSMSSGVFSKTNGDSAINGEGNGATALQGGAGKTGPDTQPNTNSVLQTLADQHTALQAEKMVERQSLQGVEQKIAQQAKLLGLSNKLSMRLEDRGLVVTVVTDRVLFDSGSAVLKPEGTNVLSLVGSALKAVDNPILIEGYTDSNPISNSIYPSNWELSSGRAGSVARYFETMGLDRTRLRPEGLADLDPVASNATPDGRARNRRVEIVVQSKLVDEALANAGLAPGETSNTNTTAPIRHPVGNPVDNQVAPGSPITSSSSAH
jgi:chemotaxis protein MotB